MSDRRVVLDASAVLAWAMGERGRDAVGRLLMFSVIPAPNLTEVLHRARVRGHRMTADQLWARIIALGAT